MATLGTRTPSSHSPGARSSEGMRSVLKAAHNWSTAVFMRTASSWICLTSWSAAAWVIWWRSNISRRRSANLLPKTLATPSSEMICRQAGLKELLRPSARRFWSSVNVWLTCCWNCACCGFWTQRSRESRICWRLSTIFDSVSSLRRARAITWRRSAFIRTPSMLIWILASHPQSPEASQLAGMAIRMTEGEYTIWLEEGMVRGLSSRQLLLVIYTGTF